MHIGGGARTNESGQETGKRKSLLNGAALFLALVVYVNLRSPGPTEAVDWAVMGVGALFFAFALVQRIRSKGLQATVQLAWPAGAHARGSNGWRARMWADSSDAPDRAVVAAVCESNRTYPFQGEEQ